MKASGVQYTIWQLMALIAISAVVMVGEVSLYRIAVVRATEWQVNSNLFCEIIEVWILLNLPLAIVTYVLYVAYWAEPEGKR